MRSPTVEVNTAKITAGNEGIKLRNKNHNSKTSYSKFMQFLKELHNAVSFPYEKVMHY